MLNWCFCIIEVFFRVLRIIQHSENVCSNWKTIQVFKRPCIFLRLEKMQSLEMCSLKFLLFCEWPLTILCCFLFWSGTQTFITMLLDLTCNKRMCFAMSYTQDVFICNFILCIYVVCIMISHYIDVTSCNSNTILKRRGFTDRNLSLYVTVLLTSCLYITDYDGFYLLLKHNIIHSVWRDSCFQNNHWPPVSASIHFNGLYPDENINDLILLLILVSP